MSDKDIQLSRRKVLAGLGTIGVASAGAGLGTTAWLSDEESFLNNVLTAGTLDLVIGYDVHVDQGSAGTIDVSGVNNGGEGEAAGGDPISFGIEDVKPGDSGHFQFCFSIHDNPAYLWACGTLTGSAENGYTEPEPVDDNGEGELDDAIQATAYYCDENGDRIGGTPDIASGSLGSVIQGITYGLPLDGDPTTAERDPFNAGDQANNACVCIDWDVPTSVGNEIQGDSLAFDLAFHAVQSRHNDGSANPCCDCGDDEVALVVGDEIHCVTPFSGPSVSDWYDYSPYQSNNDAIQEPSTATISLFREDGGDLYLVAVNDDRTSSGGGAADYTVSGLSGGQSWVVQDDDASTSDDYTASGSTATGQWQWSGGRTDGGVLGALGSTFDVTVDMLFNDAASKNPLAPGTVDDVRVIEDDGSGTASAVWSEAVGQDDAASVTLRSQCVTAAAPAGNSN